MLRTVFRSDDVPPRDRLALFDEMQAGSAHPLRFLSDRPEEFRATAGELWLGAVNLGRLTCSPAEARRTEKLIRASDPELYCVVFPLHGGLGVAQAGRETALGTHQFTLYNSSSPFHVRMAAGHATTSLVRLYLPRALVPLPAAAADRLLARPLPGREGVGALLTQFLAGLAAGGDAYGPGDVSRLAAVTVGLLTAVLAHHLDDEDLLRPESRRRALLPRVQAFVREHLHEPWLGPDAVAAAHHISVRTLHDLFREHGTTVAAWIRRERLERARRDLADPALPVHRVAARCGYRDHATFTRAFRAAYGVSPRDYRHHCLEPPRVAAS